MARRLGSEISEGFKLICPWMLSGWRRHDAVAAPAAQLSSLYGAKFSQLLLFGPGCWLVLGQNISGSHVEHQNHVISTRSFPAARDVISVEDEPHS